MFNFSFFGCGKLKSDVKKFAITFKRAFKVRKVNPTNKSSFKNDSSPDRNSKLALEEKSLNASLIHKINDFI